MRLKWCMDVLKAVILCNYFLPLSLLPSLTSSIPSLPAELLYPCYLKAASSEGVWPADITSQSSGGRGEKKEEEPARGGREGASMRGRPGQLFSDSLFCNCPNGLLSSVERRRSSELRLERGFQSFTGGLTH